MTARLTVSLFAAWLLAASSATFGARVQKHYYGHDAVEDRYGVIAPWHRAQNGQLDYRARIAAETMKRYPWTDDKRSARPLPEYIYSSMWNIDADGNITVPMIYDWLNGDLGQRASYVLSAFVDYYRYTGDPAAIAHVTWMADFLLDHCLTPADHPWPRFLISVPTKGKAYYDANPRGHIQLDIVAEVGIGLLRAYQLTGNSRWLRAAEHWGDLLAEHCDRTPGAMPWKRYANIEDVPWQDNRETGGVAFILFFFDDLIRLGYTGKDGAIASARDAGRAYMRDTLLAKWTANETWGINYWDWASAVQLENVTEFACRYMMDHKDYFPNWKNDVRNILSLFLNHTGVDPASSGEVYSGAWAYPESSTCCGRSLWYGPMEVSWPFAQYGAEADSEWGREIARRSQILATYDIHETGYSEDGIDGGPIVNSLWFKIAHPMALKHMLATIGWMPEIFAPARENHIVRSSSVVTSLKMARSPSDPILSYRTFDALENTSEVLRLSFVPSRVRAGNGQLALRGDLNANGYTVRRLTGGDCIVSIRHDGARSVAIYGTDPARNLASSEFRCKGAWQAEYDAGVEARVASEAEAESACEFNGNQVRVLGNVDQRGGLADVYLDGTKLLVGIDFWNPSRRTGQVVFYRNGMDNTRHTLRIVARGEKNPYSGGTRVCITGVHFSDAMAPLQYGEGGGPRGAQRFVFGYPGREDLVDSRGNKWRPATEWVVRHGWNGDSVEKSWWQMPVEGTIGNTSDADLYRYGAHGSELIVNFTVGPGDYHVRLKFLSARDEKVKDNLMSIFVNGSQVVKSLDVGATAGGPKKAVDLVYSDIKPRNGIIDVRLLGKLRTDQDGENSVRDKAFIQAIEIVPGNGSGGATPVTAQEAGPINFVTNPGFGNGLAGAEGAKPKTLEVAGWFYDFLSPAKSYIWPEKDFAQHPDWGLPEFHGGKQAIRTHTDGHGHTRIYQDIQVSPQMAYQASVWVRASDLHGKGFGKSATDSAGIVIEERDERGELVRAHPKAEVKDSGPYRKLSQSFIAGRHTRKVRFILDTRIACHYTEGHVTYDDAELTENSVRR